MSKSGEDLDGHKTGSHILTIPSREQLESILGYMFDEKEFLSPYGE